MKKEIKHLYLKYNGQEYFDYTGYVDERNYDKRIDDHLDSLKTIGDRIDYFKDFKNNYDITIPRGSKVHLLPGYPYAIDDIRKYYKVKRKPEDADYIIMTEEKIKSNGYTYLDYDFIVSPDEKKVYIYYSDNYQATRDYILNRAKNDIAHLDRNKLIVLSYRDITFYDNPMAKQILEKTLDDKYVFYTALDINSDEEVTVDLLKLVVATLNDTKYNADSEKNAIIQLNVLNQHNWRKYKGSLQFLFGILESRSIFYDMKNHPSRFSKPVQDILSIYNRWSATNPEYQGEKDFQMAQNLINDMMDIGEGRVCTYNGLAKKLLTERISPNIFEPLFGTKVKIEPKKYEDYEKERAEKDKKD